MKYPNNSREQKDLDTKLVKFISKSMGLFNFVEHDDFKNFVDALNKKYTLPSKSQLSEILIPALYEEVQEELHSMLQKTSYVALMTYL